jgi:flavin reductase
MSAQQDSSSDIGVGAFWRLMGMRPVGAAVVTASHDGVSAGLLALSVTHVSASPPTMLVCVGRSTSALSTIKAAHRFAINYLPAGANDIAETFGGRRQLSGAERFTVGRWAPNAAWASHAPVLADAVLALDCRVTAIFECGDTEIIAARIEHFALDDTATPLLAYRGG